MEQTQFNGSLSQLSKFLPMHFIHGFNQLRILEPFKV